MTGFSWGEVGRIVVTPAGETAARVFVDTEKVSQMQLTGTSESEFARDIFAGMKERLTVPATCPPLTREPSTPSNIDEPRRPAITI
ncbi:MAG: hypothetical protein ABMA14_23605 [Hyphomonadaceae bacterium]